MLTATVPSQEAERSIEEAAGSSKYRHKKEDSSDLMDVVPSMDFFTTLLMCHSTYPNFRLTDEWPVP